MVKDWSDFVRKKVGNYNYDDIIFTKVKLMGWLEQRNKSTTEKMREEVYTSRDLEFVEKQEIEFKGKMEERYRCYHLFSGSKGRCIILTFNSKIKIVTAFPLGRKTLNQYRKKFK